MKILKINPEKIDFSIINEAIKVLACGGVILYPTDTVYGLGANIFDKHAVKRIYSIKNRDFTKPLSVLISDSKLIPLIANLDEENEKLINNYLPGPFTFILNKKEVIPDYVTGGSENVGIRVPDNEIARNIAKIFPIITTSANISNKEVLDNPKDILNQLNHDVDLVIDIGPLNSNKPSKIIDLTKTAPELIKRD
ncbi:threonylcarbamoyl-AMP synthase [Methanobrevibacter sp. OttesenSCG-928-K11]|nr:threonylcarbamoyl-AMP synthase [Methanobrevibacter sp. OttesenSCG-928-K11]MDL2270556.1 threonylcarbamoyl-AMP synthase [Methanobrevibacter sp. OttesenSCG-928-I08]